VFVFSALCIDPVTAADEDVNGERKVHLFSIYVYAWQLLAYGSSCMRVYVGRM